MKKLLLALVLLGTTGCEAERRWQAQKAEERWASIRRTEDREASLRDGRIHIGMTDNEFARLWEKPPDVWIDRSTSSGGVEEWWKFDYGCDPASPTQIPTYYFCFENGVLDYWSKN